MRILVTGGAGFIGSNLVDRLLYLGHEVVVIDNFDESYSPRIKMKNIEHNIRKKNFRLVKGDIRDEKKLKEYLKDTDVVFHLAAKAGVRDSFKDPRAYHEVNVTGTLKVLESCLNSEIRKVIYASSSSVYGEPQTLPMDESHPTNPVSVYGATKLAGEKYCYVFSKLYGLDIVSLRYFTVFGPRQRPDEAIAKFTRLILHGKRPEIYGNGEQTRDFTFISDVVDANILAMKSRVHWGVFNIGSGKSVSVNEVVRMLNRVCKSKIKPIYTEKRKGDVSHTLANIEKARKVLKYQPKIGIEVGIRKYVEWFLKERIDLINKI